MNETTCSLENYLILPDNTMDERIANAKKQLGDSLIILGHHYQRDEVIRFADAIGDSYKLSKIAAETNAKYIVFCGVHFMAESADILSKPEQIVILPDLNAGCSMADMADISQVEHCWEVLEQMGIANHIMPITYMNSSAAIKAFCGEHEGLVCTSSNADKAFAYAFAHDKKILFIPDQHLGRNTGSKMGISLNEMTIWDPWTIQYGKNFLFKKIILWKGHCSVHQRFLPSHVETIREKYPNMKIIVHPECRIEVCEKADDIGSTEKLISLIESAPDGSSFAIGTEIHLVNRLAKKFPNKHIITLDDSGCGCLCTTMYRITPQHLCWVLENLVDGKVVNHIKVKDSVKHWANIALNRMLEV